MKLLCRSSNDEAKAKTEDRADDEDEHLILATISALDDADCYMLVQQASLVATRRSTVTGDATPREMKLRKYTVNNAQCWKKLRYGYRSMSNLVARISQRWNIADKG